MLKKVLWIAAACAVLLTALALSRGLDLGTERPKASASMVDVAAPTAEEPVTAVVETAPPPQPPAPIVATPDDLQVEEDAAAVGLTTIEPEPPLNSPAASDTPPAN